MELITTRNVLALNIGMSGNLFGGEMMSWLDLAGASYACQLCDSPRMITKKFTEIVFERPVKVGNIIKIYGEVERFGETSITINLEARKQNVERHEELIVCKTTVVFVKINAEGEPVPISDRVKVRYEDRMKEFGRGLVKYELAK